MASGERFILLVLVELPEDVTLFKIPLKAINQDILDELKLGHGWLVNAREITPKVEKAVLNVIHACSPTDSISRSDPECHAHVSKEWRKINWWPYRVKERTPVGPVEAVYQMGMYI